MFRAMDTKSRPALIGTREAARRLNVTRQHVLRLVEAGKLAPFMRAPAGIGPFLFDPADVASLAEWRAAKRTARTRSEDAL